MRRKVIRQLGFDVHRLRILMKQSDWAYLQNWADSKECTLGDAAAVFIGMHADHRRSLERYILTPLGEQVAEDEHVYLEDQKLGTGGAEW